MNRQDIDKLDFWKKRIETAQKEHFSVYITTPADWERIAQKHKAIIQELCAGKVLDAGCGYGRVSEWVPNYTGVDFSPDFIELAKKKYPIKTFIQADLKSLPFRDKEFDWAVCVSIRNMIEGYLSKEEWQKMETEIKRVANKVLILEYTDPGRYWIL